MTNLQTLTIEDLAERLADLEAQMRALEVQRKRLKQAAAELRSTLAEKRKAAKRKAAETNSAVVQLRATQAKLRATRVAVFDALRERGASRLEIEHILGCSSLVINSARDRQDSLIADRASTTNT